MSFFFQLVLLALLSWASRVGRTMLALATFLLLLAGACIVWLGVGPALERFSALGPAEATSSRRAVIVQDSWRILLDHPWLGTGLGTFETVYPRYESYYDGKIVAHAHNDFMEVVVETGLLGTLCGLAFLAMFFRSAWSRLAPERNPVLLAARTGGLVACSGLLLHGLVDFNFRIPSNALLFLLLACLATSVERPPRVVPWTAPLS